MIRWKNLVIQFSEFSLDIAWSNITFLLTFYSILPLIYILVISDVMMMGMIMTNKTRKIIGLRIQVFFFFHSFFFFANREVLPKALHALGVMMNRCLEFCIQTQVYLRKGDLNLVIPYTNISCPLFQQRLHLNMFQTLYSSVEKEITTASICLDQTIFGRQVIDEEIREAAAKRFGVISGFSKLKDMKMTIQVSLWNCVLNIYMHMNC